MPWNGGRRNSLQPEDREVERGSADAYGGKELMTPEARHEHLLVQEVGDELVIYDLESGHAHRLNRPAALVWRRCDGRTSPAEIATALRSEAGLPADEKVVWLALRNLEDASLLRAPVAPPTGRVGISRRELMKDLGAAGALMLPVVSSIVAPTAAVAQYGPGPRKGACCECVIDTGTEHVLACGVATLCGLFCRTRFPPPARVISSRFVGRRHVCTAQGVCVDP
jgi:hypothetical protein